MYPHSIEIDGEQIEFDTLSPEAGELAEAYVKLRDDFCNIRNILRQTMDKHAYKRLEAYGLGHTEAGLTEDGDTMPCPYTIQKAVVEVVKKDVESKLYVQRDEDTEGEE